MSLADSTLSTRMTGEQVTYEIPARVRRVLRLAGRTDREAAEHLRMDPARFSERMNHKTKFSVGELVDVANLCEASPSVFFDATALAEWVSLKFLCGANQARRSHLRLIVTDPESSSRNRELRTVS